MKWLAWVACLGLAAFIAVTVWGGQSRGISAQLQPIDHALVSPDGRVITAPALGGGCVTRVALTASETGMAVRLRLTAYSVTGRDVACPADAQLLQASTTLRGPLGGRRLIDASRDRQIRYLLGTHLAQPAWLLRGLLAARN